MFFMSIAKVGAVGSPYFGAPYYNALLSIFLSNHINVDIVGSSMSTWCLKSFYGYPESRRRRDYWNFTYHLTQPTSLLQCIMEDFNDIISASKKKGHREHAS